jgi:hypothetical protein
MIIDIWKIINNGKIFFDFVKHDLKGVLTYRDQNEPSVAQNVIRMKCIMQNLHE